MHTNDDHAPPLAAMMEALRVDMAGLSSPASVEAALTRAFAGRHRRPSWWRRHATLLWSAAGAAGAGALALTLVLGSQPDRPRAGPQIARLDPARAHPGAAPAAASSGRSATLAEAAPTPGPADLPAAEPVRPRVPAGRVITKRPAPRLLAAREAPSQNPVRPEPVPEAIEGFGSGGEFVALASAESINQATDTRIVRRDLRRIQLASLGVQVTPQNADDMIRAEMLVGSGEQPLALRLLTIQ